MNGGAAATTARFDPPGGGLRGSLRVPADKSISHRAALFGAMSSGAVRVRNYLHAADTDSTLAAVQALGTRVEQSGTPGELTLHGVGLRGARALDGALDVGNAGTLMRLICGWLAGQPAGTWTLDGDDSIRSRPMDRVVAPLRLMGARIDAREDRFAPLTIHGGSLHGIAYASPVASAQVKSCVLIAGLATPEGASVTEPHPSRDHTERLLASAGVPLSRDGLRVTVAPVDALELGDVDVPGDLSSAAFFVAAALLVPGSRVVLENVNVNWTRTGFLRIAERMGARIGGQLEPPGGFTAGEPVSDLEVAHGPLRGTTVEADEVPLAIDELPLVALLGCCAEGETVVRGAQELRVKESDRIATVVEGLRALGAEIEATDDGFVVQGRGAGALRGGRIASHGDHRLAMLGAVAGLASRAGVEVDGMEAAAVSYPGFAADLAGLIAR
ncbi:MAG: 3-phosphoshikimate 1-carboxyvinyltransferase [Actinobacteria bacterium]|nr:3-phosphoshikimate 1-carboxyvinyltransferase [Actinomycetota bacterium]